MNRFLTPIILIVLAVALFAVYTNGAYQGTKALNDQLTSYNTALDQSEQIIKLRDNLLAERNALPADGLAKLQLLLPDNVDNIRLIIDINDIAARYHLQVESISINSSNTSQAGTASVGTNTGPVGTVSLSFTVQSSYSNFKAFLADLTRSLRLVDITDISFSAAGKDADTYTMAITTYWLKK